MRSPVRPDSIKTAAREGAMRYRIRHSSAYRYGADIMLAHHLLHLTPRATPGQRVTAFNMTIAPDPSVKSEHRDYFGNPAVYLEMHEPHRTLTIQTEIDIEVATARPATTVMQTPWEDLRSQLQHASGPGARAASTFAYASPMITLAGALTDFALPSFTKGRAIGEAAMDLTNRIHAEFTFDPEATTIATPVLEVLEKRRGVCQDFAHLQIACLRSLGLSARYVSGYLRTIPPAGKAQVVGADVSHAWLSVWCGEDRWLDLDPTNGRPGSSDLITLAWGRDYGDVSPSQGVIIGSNFQELKVEVDVRN